MSIYISFYFLPATCKSNCNGHGLCTGPNKCSCTPGWQGDKCQTGNTICLIEKGLKREKTFVMTVDSANTSKMYKFNVFM